MIGNGRTSEIIRPIWVRAAGRLVDRVARISGCGLARCTTRGVARCRSRSTWWDSWPGFCCSSSCGRGWAGEPRRPRPSRQRD